MARARNIKPGFFKNEELGELNPFARLLFAGLWTIADREGRLEDRPKRIKAEVLPYDDVDVDALLAALAGAGFILRYQVDGHSYISVPKFLKHQNPHTREAPSTIPAPGEHGASTVPEQGKHGTGPASSSIPSNPSPSSRSTVPEQGKTDDPNQIRVDGDEPLEAEQAFKHRLSKRHGKSFDVEGTLKDVKRDLEVGNVPLADFLKADSRKTTNPKALRNPVGHYRRLAQRVVHDAKSRFIAQVAGISMAAHDLDAYSKFKPKCETCKDGMLSDSQYCKCKAGQVRREMAS